MKHWTSYAFLLLVLSLNSCLAAPTPFFSPTPTPLMDEPLEIAPLAPLREQWRIRAGQIDQSGHYPMLLTNEGIVFAPLDGPLTLVDDKDGRIVWQTPFEAGQSQTLATDGERVFSSHDWRVSAYDLETGEFLWQTRRMETHRVYLLFVEEGRVLAYEDSAWDPGVFHVFDAESGAEIEEIVLPLRPGEEAAPFLITLTDETAFWALTNRRLYAIDRCSEEVLWDIPVYYPRFRFIPFPAFWDNLMAVTVGGNLLALNREDGNVVWQKGNVVSNPVFWQGQLYATTKEGNIHAYDPLTGQDTLMVEVEPNLAPLQDQYILGRILLAQENPPLLYAYYAESEELIAFRKED